MLIEKMPDQRLLASVMFSKSLEVSEDYKLIYLSVLTIWAHNSLPSRLSLLKLLLAPALSTNVQAFFSHLLPHRPLRSSLYFKDSGCLLSC